MKEFEFVPEGMSDCKVKAWIHAMNGSSEMPASKRPAVIICPGGGYGFVSDREAEPVAMEFFAKGYNTYILRYSIGEKAKKFRPLCQLAATIADIRKNSEQWFTVSDKIAVCGFSAGGHLAASMGTLYKKEEFLKVFQRKDHIRPDAMILGYPVITSDEFTHISSIENVSGDCMGGKEYKWFGLDQHVSAETSPAFIWHTASDALVPVENSLKMASALSAAKVPFELHILPSGQHGLSVCTQEVNTPCDYNGRWVQWCITWLNKLFQFRP